jgi:hypothetical protein
MDCNEVSDSILQTIDLSKKLPYRHQAILVVTDRPELTLSNLCIENLNYSFLAGVDTYLLSTSKYFYNSRFSNLFSYSSSIHSKKDFQNFCKNFSSNILQTYNIEYPTLTSQDSKRHTLEIRYVDGKEIYTQNIQFKNEKIIFTPKMIYYAIISGLIFIIISLICILLRKFYTARKNNQQNFYAEDIQFFVPDTDNFYTSKETNKKTKRIIEPIELQKYPSAYVFLNNQQKVDINSDEFSIGSSRANDLIVNEVGVSQRHCKIKFVENGFCIFDLISQTGTFLNGKKLLRPRKLKDWDEIRIGNALLVFRRV